ncbi:complexin-2 [Butyrivibrio sp. INlla14]|uniref:complexin-2 n=1 Tax=Butyrivibrio sp. INlla14 TaxID=1520808 RepID=UPI0008771FB0|nr:complexin-2 [Butyrivibrio sp. INlla14]SCY59231.1 hypothetical protein SAMN02910371_02921 [Butyrivibrio sp. INlla14]
MKKNIQIPYELFIELIHVHLLENEDPEIWKRIAAGLNTKIDSLVMHELYEKYKTAPSEEEREKARQEYLNRRGIHKDFRW